MIFARPMRNIGAIPPMTCLAYRKVNRTLRHLLVGRLVLVLIFRLVGIVQIDI